MAEPLPKFDAPPVVETAMSVQFARLAGYSTPLIGWFWKSHLPQLSQEKKWEKTIELPRLEDRFERFGDKEKWSSLTVRMMPAGDPQRTQIIQSGEERMVQVQDSRFILNWRKKTGPYPSFKTLSSEFWTVYPQFEQFAVDAGIGPVEPNQWELIYVNHIPRGELWDSACDLQRVFPNLTFPQAAVAEATAEPIALDWRFGFKEERGRLYAGLRNARSAAEPSADSFLELTFTARGPIDPDKGWFITQGFELGHECIVRTFTAMTSSESHKLWKRRI